MNSERRARFGGFDPEDLVDRIMSMLKDGCDHELEVILCFAADTINRKRCEFDEQEKKK